MTEYIEKWLVVNRLIDLENEFQQYKPFHGFEHAMYRKICEVEIAIGKTPDADVAPVQHAKWEIVVGSNGKEYMVCTGCRKQQDLTGVFSYCPNCGAKMDETVEDDER